MYTYIAIKTFKGNNNNYYNINKYIILAHNMLRIGTFDLPAQNVSTG